MANDNSKRDSRVDELFEQALSCGAEDRSQFLANACQNDPPSVLVAVQKMLKAHGEVEAETDFLREGPFLQARPDTSLESPGTIIGPYKLLQQIGEGGFGIVYMADQLRPVQRRVALKVIKPGMDSRQVLARFEAERQALALMDHPNIAKVFDAGTTKAGRPYFVMELVKGIPVTKFCDEQQLGIRERLELFVPICHAIQHAHQKGIIHRDIKPSNLLISQYDGQSVPKVIDFGVAKAINQRLTERTMVTQLGQVVGTLQYMSPEQSEMNQLDIDTRSDIYSLGSVLYELLTGTTPIEKARMETAAIEEVLRVIRDEEPQRPSQRLSSSLEIATVSQHRKMTPVELPKTVQGELDCIVMKSLDKQRSRRYETANEFARDIQRYLANEPVEASPPSITYRLRKFVSKHRRAIGVTAAFVGVLCLAAIIIVLQEIDAYRADMATNNIAMQADLERERARVEADAHQLTQAALASEQRLFYFNRIVLADRELLSNNIVRAKQLLQECPEGLRRWEWSYLNKICQQELFSLPHDSPVTAVAYSPDGKLLATGTYEKKLQIWDLQTRSVIRPFPGHTISVRDIEFSSDGQRLITCAGHQSMPQGEVKVWNLQTGETIIDVDDIEFPVFSLATSPDDKYVAFVHGTLGGPIATVCDLANGTVLRVLKGHRGPVTDVAFSPDSQRIVTAGYKEPSLSGDKPGEFKVWEVSNGNELWQQTAMHGPIWTVDYSPDGSSIVTGGFDGAVRVWDAATGQEISRLAGHRGGVNCVTFTASALLASAGHDGSVKLWNPHFEHRSTTLRGHSDVIETLAVDPEQPHIASGSNDGTAKIWDTSDEDAFTLRGHSNGIGSVIFSPDGTTLATGSQAGRTLRIWDAETGLQLFASLRGRILDNFSSLSFSPDGSSLAIVGSDDFIRILNCETYHLTVKCTAKHKDSWITSLDFSPDGSRLAALSLGSEIGSRGEILVFDSKSGEATLRFPAHVKAGFKIGCIQFSRDGRLLVTAGTENDVRIWNADTGQSVRVLKGHTEAVLSVAIGPDNRWIATASDDNNVKLWDLETGDEIRTFYGHTTDVTSVVFSPDGTRLVSGANDATVKMWDVESGQEIITLRGHEGKVRGVSTSADGKRIAAGSEDSNIRVWSSIPLTPELRDRRRAAKIVNELTATPMIREDVILAIASHREIEPIVRKYALEMANQYHENANLHFKQAMILITNRGATMEQYHAALRFAQSAARLRPEDVSHRNMVGMGLFRTGAYQQAIDILTETDAEYSKSHEGGVPYNLSYLAMAYHKLGDDKLGIETLDRLDGLMMPVREPQDASHETTPDVTAEDKRPKRIDYNDERYELYRSMHDEATKLIRESESTSASRQQASGVVARLYSNVSTRTLQQFSLDHFCTDLPWQPTSDDTSHCAPVTDFAYRKRR